MDKRIVVTEEDIKLGCRMSLGACPIALAASRTLGQKVEVDGSYIHLVNKDPEGFAPWQPPLGILPAEAREFVHKFDNGKETEPFDFEPLPVPEQWKNYVAGQEAETAAVKKLEEKWTRR